MEDGSTAPEPLGLSDDQINELEGILAEASSDEIRSRADIELNLFFTKEQVRLLFEAVAHVNDHGCEEGRKRLNEFFQMILGGLANAARLHDEMRAQIVAGWVAFLSYVTGVSTEDIFKGYV